MHTQVPRQTASTCLRESRTGRFSEHAGRNARERRAGLEKLDAEADPPMDRGRLPATGSAHWGRRPVASAGVGAAACVQDERGSNSVLFS